MVSEKYRYIQLVVYRREPLADIALSTLVVVLNIRLIFLQQRSRFLKKHRIALWKYLLIGCHTGQKIPEYTDASLEAFLIFILLHTAEVERCWVIYFDEKIVVGKVISWKPHPDSDKLWLVQVDAGKHGQHEIVCGAPNAKTSQYVPVALEHTSSQEDSSSLVVPFVVSIVAEWYVVSMSSDFRQIEQRVFFLLRLSGMKKLFKKPRETILTSQSHSPCLWFWFRIHNQWCHIWSR